jgi:hypothetical protein
MHLESMNVWTITIFNRLQHSDYDAGYETQFAINIEHQLLIA